MNIYITQAGDTWDKIAKEVYGSESYTSFLMENNQSELTNFVFPGGIELKIPDLPMVDDMILPEWRY